MERKLLSDILHGDRRDRLNNSWKTTDAAPEFAPLPPGEYVAHIISGELFESKSGTPGYKLTFQVADGDYANRQFWHDCWLTDAAIAMTKRDLAKIGITNLEQCESPVPKGIRASVRLSLRRDDDGNERNRVVKFEVTGIDKPTPDPFAPPSENGKGEPK